MAMTGGTAYLVKSEYTNSGQNNWTTDLYIYVKIVSQNPAANTSTIALGMYVYSKYNIDWGDWIFYFSKLPWISFQTLFFL